ncbi:MAG: GH92 family glycosyl hydrolase [Nitrososphaerota archaeon]|nr:GH92 family glycosyl hydrolase [Nitrososphaerota archaeon]MDG6966816.1 GH92 family glycosyl hydrolase [Nitrososphaerota archaeon]
MFRRVRRRTALALAALLAALLVGVAAEQSFRTATPQAPYSLPPAFAESFGVAAAPSVNLTRLVNPFIGTSDSAGPLGAGDTFPGADYPMGMVQWSPDTVSNPPGGYDYNDTTIKDFSLTHFSGRGCQVYQDFPFMPFVGEVTVSPASDPSAYYSAFSHSTESARPGYYQVHLDTPNVTVQLSATPHTGVGAFTYPASTLSTMLINAGGSINGNSHSDVSIDPSKGEVTGSGESTVGCGSNPYTLYFAAEFSRPFKSYGVWDGPTLLPAVTSADGQYTGAYLTFDTTSQPQVDVQVGISFVSVRNAELNLRAESVGFDLGAAAAATADAWNSRLSSVLIGGGTQAEQTVFYTALYHVFIDPNIFSDDNGQYLGFDGQVHTLPSGHVQYEDITGWDGYRTYFRLLAVLDPSAMSDVAQSLVNDAQQGNGALPRWEQANADSHGMSGDDGDPVIQEAYAFGATDFNTSGALQAMIGGQPVEREGYSSYASLGYLPADRYPGLSTASITLEYANDDFAIAQFARALGDTAVYQQYLQRSASWKNLFNTTSGYIQPRLANGSWAPGFVPTSDYGFQEGDSAQYTWMVTFDLKDLFSMMGGNSTAVLRLDSFLLQLNAGPTAPFAWMGDEPSVEVPWEYDFAQAPSRTQAVVRTLETQYWTDSPGGLLGNDDGGEMSSWYVFAALGIYPEITGIGGFVMGSPLFPTATVQLAGGRLLQIDATGASPSSPYVQSLEVNGSPTTSLWLPWSSVQGGATLNFTLGPDASGWGSAPGDAPPSFP